MTDDVANVHHSNMKNFFEDINNELCLLIELTVKASSL